MSWFFGSQPEEAPNPVTTIEKLCDRVRDAHLLEDRRSAVQGLRALARSWQLEVGTKGMPALIKVLKNDRMDVEIIKLTLETLNMLFTSEEGGKEDLGIMMTEIFVKDPSNVALLLDILAEVDFYVRFNCVQLLSTLFKSVGHALHDGILTSPLGISRLIDLLDDRREIIRNDGLLLLINLTEANADIQKIVAFENAFERLFSILLEEGAVDGGIIVQDCLQLMHNLLRYNTSNQNLFRETNCIKQVPKLLACRRDDPRKGVIEIPLTDQSIDWSEQKKNNALFVIELVRILVIGKNHNTSVNQELLGKTNAIQLLFDTAMEPKVPEEVRVDAFQATGDLIRCNEASREKFAKMVATVSMVAEHSGLPNQKSPPGTPTNSLVALVQTILEKQSLKIRMGALYTLKCYLEDNLEGQKVMALSLHPTKGTKTGKRLFDILNDLDLSKKDPFRTWFTCMVLLQTVMNNPKAKEILLSIAIVEHEESVSLMNKICYSLMCATRDSMDAHISMGILMLLSVWLFDFSVGVKEFLSEGSNMQYLIEQISQSSGIDPVIQGLSAFLYGVLYQFNDNSEPTFTQKNMQSLILSRIGADTYQSRVHRLQESKAFSMTEKAMFEETDTIFDFAYLEFMRTHLDFITKMVTAPKKATKFVDTNHPEISDLKAQLAAVNKELARKDEDIATMKSVIAQLQGAPPAKVNADNVSQEKIHKLEELMKEKDQKLEYIEQEHEDLLLCLADQELEIRNLKKRLMAYGEVFDESDSDE